MQTLPTDTKTTTNATGRAMQRFLFSLCTLLRLPSVPGWTLYPITVSRCSVSHRTHFILPGRSLYPKTKTNLSELDSSEFSLLERNHKSRRNINTDRLVYQQRNKAEDTFPALHEMTRLINVPPPPLSYSSFSLVEREMHEGARGFRKKRQNK